MTISGGNQHNNNANRKYEKLIKQPQMQFGSSVTGTQTDVDSCRDADADANAVRQDFSNFNKHFGNGHAITDRTMLLRLEDDVTTAAGIVTYKGKSNGNGNGNGNGSIGSISLDFNGSPTSSTSIGIASGSSSNTHLASGGGVGGIGGSEPAGWMCHCCNLIARRCFGINVRRCVLALLAITMVSIFYYTHYVDTGVFNG
nr:sulfateless, isoform D [Drosophila melanogaster]AAY55633.1 IP02947p [Drosophila melanogaster]UYI58701.1 sulfateless, isoform D [Drosophila melanogaster]